MKGTQPPTFRPTVEIWPAQPPDLPPLQPEDVVESAEPGRYHLRGFLPQVAVPEDFVLRECCAFDPEDDEALLGFIRGWGRLTPRDSRDGLDSLPYRGLIWVLDSQSDPATRESLAALLAPESRFGRVQSLDLERLYLRLLRALAGHYRAHVLGGSVVDAWAAAGFTLQADQSAGVWEVEARAGTTVAAKWKAEVRAWDMFARVMDAALRAFAVHLRLNGRPIMTFEWVPSTYEVAVLQLARIVAEDRPVLVCANERCRGPFTRQRGRAKYPGAEHARGVRYCSRECARAQAERDRRARRAAEKPAKGVGR